jgi:DNA processing protein
MISNLHAVLLAAAVLRIPSHRMRALARGDEAALRDWITGESAYRLAEARREARVALMRLEELGARVVTLADADYPAGVKELAEAPPFLIARGTLPVGTTEPEGIAIVGTREADEKARSFARELAARLAAPIVSGLARGIDAAAHEGALAAGAPTIAYVGNGLGATYPPENRDLEERIVAGGGAVLSERLPGEPVANWALVKRDRLQAAHPRVIVLVQSEADGGAMYAMRFARELRRARFALEPRGHSTDAYVGNARAIAEGATPLPWDVDEACRLILNSTKRSRV